ncbi:MAG TPA: alanine--tRNA ligase [Acholeplasmataceae bacterium]|nr:alanine--tRNA ligase [Acholeplasmataceae bacterium]
MKYMTSLEIRNMWLNFFKDKNHTILESASLIPHDDKTLLWINAGVAPLKKYFDGREKPVDKRLANVQKCLRTNDIENVGYTSRHHTFFEMLGNFSIGDYFRDEAIEYGFEILTSEKYFNFPLEKLIFTYYPTDIETRDKWISLGVDPKKVISSEHNYWEIGAGPSGPNTEIFFDRGEKFDKRGLELVSEDIENNRYVEIWNIVFSQYNADPKLKRSEYKELPNKNIDTGAGLERFASIIQNAETNFETDLFLPIINKIEELSNVKYSGQTEFKIIADHIKTLVFTIADGAILSNEGRGYVLRRLLRRALKHGRKLGFNKPFLHELVDVVILIMQDFYKDIGKNQVIIKRIILKEEKQFLNTIADGEKHLIEIINKNENIISGSDAFKLYDTYGFPIELTEEYASEHNIKVDLLGFEEELNIQKLRSKNARENVSSMQSQDEKLINFKEKSTFIGYENYTANTKVIAVFDNGVVLEETPFYANSGGQVSDKGTINGIVVNDVVKLPNKQHLHLLEHNLEVGDDVVATINQEYRNEIRKNHSATHLLHQALKDILGNHVNQQGSNVSNRTLRFDFNHFEHISNNELIEIEEIVNNKINENIPVIIKSMPLDDAIKLGAQALFGEKYEDIVRVVDMGYSIELCGGTHVTNTNEIKQFSITKIESIGSGIFRVEASTDKFIESGIKAEIDYVIREINQLNEKGLSLDQNFKMFETPKITGSFKDIIKAKSDLEEYRTSIFSLEKTLEELKTQNILKNADTYLPKNPQTKEIIKTKDINIPTLKQLVDVLYDKIKAETLLVVNITDDKATYIAKTDGKTNASDLIKTLAKLSNGSGGGKPNLAQGGTKDFNSLENALKIIKEKL